MVGIGTLIIFIAMVLVAGIAASVLIITSNCFSGIDTRTAVSGKIIPEYGMRRMIAFNTPPAFIDTIIELQP